MTPVDVAVWRRLVRGSAPGVRAVAVAMILGDLAEPLALGHWTASEIRLGDAVVRRLVNGAHVHPAGLRRILDRLLEAGYLARVRPPLDSHWGSYVLVLPRECPAFGVRPLCRITPRRRRGRSPAAQSRREHGQRSHAGRRRPQN